MNGCLRLAGSPRSPCRWLGRPSLRRFALSVCSSLAFFDRHYLGDDCNRDPSGDPPMARWREVPQGHYVHGCLTDGGAYAVYDAAVAVVPGPNT